MSPSDDIKQLIVNHNRRLQKLKEQQALKGLSSGPEILIEIEDIEAEIAVLQTELKTLESQAPPTQLTAESAATPREGNVAEQFQASNRAASESETTSTIPPTEPQPTEPTENFDYDVYISYVDKEPDGTWVWETLVPHLEAAKLRIAVSGVVGRRGVAKTVNIERALEQSKRIILVLSPNYLADKQIADFESVLGEMMGLWQGTYRLLPVKIMPIADDQMSSGLRRLDMLDLTHPRQAKNWVAVLLEELQRPLPLRGHIVPRRG